MTNSRISRLIRAALGFMVGVALLLSGCQPKMEVKRPVIPPGPFQQAEKAFKAGNFNRAIALYTQYLNQAPKGPKAGKALYRIAFFYHDTADFDKALPFYRRFIDEYPGHPKRPDAIFELAKTYHLLENYAQCEIEAAAWLRLYPDHQLEGEVLFLRGKNSNARNDLPNAFRWLLLASEALRDSKEKENKIDGLINGLIKSAPLTDLDKMATIAAGSVYSPKIHHRITSIYIDGHKLEEARKAAMALVRSTTEQYWVSLGRKMLESIDDELSVKKGVIGCLLPLSGPFAIYGREVLNGMQIAMGVFDGSKEESDIELVIMDTESNPEGAVSGISALVENHKVMAIIGPLSSKSAVAAAKKAQALGVPIITLTQKDRITEEGDMVFRNFLTPSKEIDKILDKTITQMTWKRFGILYPDNSYGRFFMNLFWDGVEMRGGKITAVESYKPEETDFALQIKKMVGLHYPRPESVKEMLRIMKTIEEESPEAEEETPDETSDSEEEPEPIVDFDAVFIPDNYQRVAMIAPQFPFYNVFDIPFLGTSLWQSPDLIKTAREYVQKAIFPSGFFEYSETDSMVNFVNFYQSNFENPPGILAATGYDTIKYIKSMLTNKEIRTRKDFQKSMLTGPRYYGLTGEIAFDRQGEVVKQPILLTVTGRRFQILP